MISTKRPQPLGPILASCVPITLKSFCSDRAEPMLGIIEVFRNKFKIFGEKYQILPKMEIVTQIQFDFAQSAIILTKIEN